jgi:uncharacterized repeat protein (TIGR01451 family)
MKILRLISPFILLALILPACLPATAALGQDEVGSSSGNMTLNTEFPKMEALATATFTFSVKLSYEGDVDRAFDLNVTAPTNWDAYVTPQYDSQRISSVTMEASTYAPTEKTLKVITTPPTWPVAEPDDYVINFKVSSGSIIGTIDLTAVITGRYALNAAPSNQLYNTKAKAGRDNTYSIVVANTGTDTLNNVTFSASKPDGWEVTFKPDKIDALEIFDTRTVDVNIKPAANTVAGDYMITLTVSGKQSNATNLDVRVTVATSSIWGWLGVIIIVLVVIGLVVIFMRFGRR